MNPKFSGAMPIVSAAVVPGAVVTYFMPPYGSLANLFFAWIVLSLIAAAHVLLLGIPGLLLLNRQHFVNVWSLLLVGFVAGCLPVTILSGLTRYFAPMITHDKGDVVVFLFCGALGILGALSGIVTFRAMRSNNRWRGP